MQGSSGVDDGSCQVVFRLVVPNANCGSLIGKAGNNIRELREVSCVQFFHYSLVISLKQSVCMVTEGREKSNGSLSAVSGDRST